MEEMKNESKLFDPSRHKTQLNQLSFGLTRVSYKLMGGDRMTLSYGTDVKIHGSEIHMICHIKHNPGSHISGIARAIKVTRGAVSQIVMKLEKKGLVRKVENPENKRRLDLVLTEKGEKAYIGHQKLHRAFSENLKTIVSGYSQEEMDLVSSFVSDLEGSVDQLIEEVYAEEYFKE